MKFFKAIFEAITEIVFLLSLMLLGKFDVHISHNITSDSYQLVIAFFWMSGVLRFGLLNNDVKKFMVDSIKSFIVAILAIPLLYCISPEIQDSLFEPISTIFHFIALMIVLKLIQTSENLSGKIVYYTYASIPIIVFILSTLGMNNLCSVIIGGLLPYPINYYYYLKRKRK